MIAGNRRMEGGDAAIAWIHVPGIDICAVGDEALNYARVTLCAGKMQRTDARHGGHRCWWLWCSRKPPSDQDRAPNWYRVHHVEGCLEIKFMLQAVVCRSS